MEINFIKFTHIYKENIGLDVYIPKCASKPLPVIVYIHGGALIWGSRENVHRDELTAVLDEGMAYVSIDYRLAPETKLMDIQDDVKDAFNWVRGTGVDLYDFDVNRIAALGKSAGGYLALLSGTFDHKPQAIISFYGYGDILGDCYSRPSQHYLQFPSVPEDEAVKCIVQDVPTYAKGDDRWPIYLRARQTGTWASLVSGYEPSETNTALTAYCPILNIDENFPPTFLLHGSADTDVPLEKSTDMYDALIKKGIKTQLYIQQEGHHGFDSKWKNTPEEFGEIIHFLKDTLRL